MPGIFHGERRLVGCRVRYQTTKDHPYCPSLLKLFILANPNYIEPKNDTNELIYQTEIDSQTYGYQKDSQGRELY